LLRFINFFSRYGDSFRPSVRTHATLQYSAKTAKRIVSIRSLSQFLRIERKQSCVFFTAKHQFFSGRDVSPPQTPVYAPSLVAFVCTFPYWFWLCSWSLCSSPGHHYTRCVMYCQLHALPLSATRLMSEWSTRSSSVFVTVRYWSRFMTQSAHSMPLQHDDGQWYCDTFVCVSVCLSVCYAL